MKLSFVKELKSHSRLSVVLLTIFLLGCNQITSASSLSEPEPHLMNEPIYGVETNGDSVKFIVKSTGCTQAKHFSVT